jgi:hypothetical protein
VSGQTVSFPATTGTYKLVSGSIYVFALFATPQAPTVLSALPSYCSNYAPAVANANSAPQPVTFTDLSGTGAKIYLYVVSGADGNGSNQHEYLAANGTMTNFTVNATAPPIPLDCFPGSTNPGTGQTFMLPPPKVAQQSGNLYIAYATPLPSVGGVPSAIPPNPLTFIGASGGSFNGPGLDWSGRFPGGQSTYVATPWDYVEYTLPTGTTDITQVDKVGLPLQITQGGTTVGFQAGQYQQLLSDITADPTYKVLAVSGQLNGRSLVARILSPQQAIDWGFPQDWWYNNTFSPAYNAGNKGYVGYVLSQYQTTPQLYTTPDTGQTCAETYNAKSDGLGNVVFTAVTSQSPVCGSGTSPGNATYTMPAYSSIEGSGGWYPFGSVCGSGIFSMPWGGPAPDGPLPNVLSDWYEFYLWKAMVIDLSRGVALQPGPHPIGSWYTQLPLPTGPPPPPSVFPVAFSSLFLDPVYNKYAYLVHKYMYLNKSYALQYDEPGGLAPTFTSNTKQTLQITIQQIPTMASVPIPTVQATPLACPNS